VHFGEGLGERQAEAGALVLPRQPRIDLAEGRQCCRDVLGFHTDPGIRDGQDRPPVCRSQSHLDAAAGVGELDRVRYQVQQHLPQFLIVAGDDRRRIGEHPPHFDFGAPALIVHHAEAIRDNLGEVDRLATQFRAPRLALSVVEHAVDDIEQVPSALHDKAAVFAVSRLADWPE
jgi:hypothetical protein